MSNKTVIQNKQVIAHTPALLGDAIGDSQALVPQPTRQWVCLFRTFKKTAPCEFIRGVRLSAGTETRPCFLPSEVSKN